MMISSKGKVAAVLLAAAAFVGTGVIVTLDDAHAQIATTRTTKAEVREKGLIRLRTAENALASIERRLLEGAEPLSPAAIELQCVWMKRVLEARLDVTEDPGARLHLTEQYVQQVRGMVRTLQQRTAEDVTRVQMTQADYQLADAEYLLAKMQAQ